MTSYSVLQRSNAKYWYAKTGTLKPSHHVPKNLLAQRKPRFSGTWWKLKRIRKEIKGEKRELLWTRLRGVSNCDKLLNLDNFPLTMPVREIYAPELSEYGEASDRRVLFPRPSWARVAGALKGRRDGAEPYGETCRFLRPSVAQVPQ